jgi:type I restriction enzyme R subunit
VAGLPSALTDDDFDAKQLTCCSCGLSSRCCAPITSSRALRKKIVTVAGFLEELQNIPMVAAELALILELQTDEYWEDVTVPMLETVRRRLCSLLKLIEFTKRPIIYSDFEDEIGAGAAVEVSGVPVGTDMDRFRAN